jgi:DNA-binding SARP family transcriptional activator
LISAFRVHLFGRYSLQWNDHELYRCDVGKIHELFCYLLFYRDRPHSREALAGQFWGDSTAAQSKKYLRQALWQIQTLFNTATTRDDVTILAADADWIRIEPTLNIWLDVALFDQTYTKTRGVTGRDLTNQQLQLLRTAIELYQGDLLEGWYQDWCIYERERLQNAYLSMLDKLMAFCEAHHEFEAGLDYGVTILRYDRACERTHRQLMRLYYLAGDRTAALRQYQRCIQALQEELDVQPAAQTTALYQQVCADTLSATPYVLRAPRLEPRHEAIDTDLQDVLDDLHKLHQALTDAQQTILHRMEVMQHAISAEH